MDFLAKATFFAWSVSIPKNAQILSHNPNSTSLGSYANLSP